MIKGVIFRGIGGVLLVLFGILFLLFLPRTGSELATDAIFIGAGVLILRSAFLNYRKQKMQAPSLASTDTRKVAQHSRNQPMKSDKGDKKSVRQR